MMMLIIFLITDISMVGIFAGVYGNIAKYQEGMLMGVHIPKSELEHPNVKELLQLYKKHTTASFICGTCLQELRYACFALLTFLFLLPYGHCGS